MPNWTYEYIATLKRCIAGGFSCSQTSVEFWREHHVDFSRNAVIGKMHRLGLTAPLRERTADEGVSAATVSRKHERKSRSSQKTRKVVKRVVLTGRNHGTAQVIETQEFNEPMSQLSPDDIPLAQRKQLVELQPNDCRWPYGDVGQPDFFFCGGVKDHPAGPYCAYHARLACQPFPSRRPYIPPRVAAA